MIKGIIVGGIRGKLREKLAKDAVSRSFLGFISYKFMGNLIFPHRWKASNLCDITHLTTSMGISFRDAERGLSEL